MLEKIPGLAAAFYNTISAKGFRDIYKKIANEIISEIELSYKSHLNKNKKIKILDIGTGPGHLPFEIAGLNKNVEVVGLDLSMEMGDFAQKNARRKKEDRVKFKLGDAHNLPFENDSFDFITSTFSLHHWRDKTKVFKECLRVIRNKGPIRIYGIIKDAPRKEIKKSIMGRSFFAWYLSWAMKFHGLKTIEWKTFKNNFNIEWSGALVCLMPKR